MLDPAKRLMIESQVGLLTAAEEGADVALRFVQRLLSAPRIIRLGSKALKHVVAGRYIEVADDLRDDRGDQQRDDQQRNGLPTAVGCQPRHGFAQIGQSVTPHAGDRRTRNRAVLTKGYR